MRLALRVLVCPLFCAFFFLPSSAKQNQSANQQTTSNHPAQQAASQPAELAEAARLSQEVVKLYQEGRYAEALPLAKRELELREKVLGPENNLVTVSLTNVVLIYMAEGKYGEAEPLCKRLLATYEKTLKPDDPLINKTLDRLALIYYVNGDYGKAESSLLRALSSREKSLGPEDTEVARTLVNLARFYQNLNHNNKAEAAYQRAVSIMEKKSGPVPADIAKLLEGHLCLAYGELRNNEAMELQKRIYKILAPPESRLAAKANAKNQGNLEGGVLNGKAISKPAPGYPLEAKQAHISGTVVIQITVDETGRVIEARPLCGDPLLAKASVVAARQARFTPTLLSGMPVKVSGIITYHFILR